MNKDLEKIKLFRPYYLCRHTDKDKVLVRCDIVPWFNVEERFSSFDFEKDSHEFSLSITIDVTDTNNIKLHSIEAFYSCADYTDYVDFVVTEEEKNILFKKAKEYYCEEAGVCKIHNFYIRRDNGSDIECNNIDEFLSCLREEIMECSKNGCDYFDVEIQSRLKIK